MEEERDPFDYMLAEALGRTVAELNASISNAEYIEWRAFYTWRNAKADLELKANGKQG